MIKELYNIDVSSILRVFSLFNEVIRVKDHSITIGSGSEMQLFEIMTDKRYHIFIYIHIWF